jgi:hypothetical protein
MNCPHTTAPNDEELVSCALDEEPLTAKAKEHLEHCAICQQRLASYERVNRLLLARLYRSRCPSASQLNHYCAGMLPPDDAITVEQHLQDCPLCTQEVGEIRRILDAFDPSFVAATTQPLNTVSFRTVASLAPWQPPLATYSESDSQPPGLWPRRYRASDLHISLHLSYTGRGKFILLGILSSVNNSGSSVLEGCSVDLYHTSGMQGMELEDAGNASPFMTGTIDAIDTIVFTALPAGTYAMVVHMPGSDIIIPEVTITRG